MLFQTKFKIMENLHDYEVLVRDYENLVMFACFLISVLTVLLILYISKTKERAEISSINSLIRSQVRNIENHRLH
jgi:hypothetical protein